MQLFERLECSLYVFDELDCSSLTTRVRSDTNCERGGQLEGSIVIVALLVGTHATDE